MKIKESNKSITGGVLRSCVQTIASENIDRATALFRDRIYTDKKKAAICEPICNAIDEHRKHNVDRPIDVVFTTTEIIIRDFARGLSDDDVLNIFFQYFRSTKDTDNAHIGGFGIGAKAPGAYNPIYFVESFFEGKHTVFMSVPDGFRSTANLIQQEDTDLPSGICVRIPLLAGSQFEDRQEFLRIAQDVSKMIGFYRPANKREIRLIDDKVHAGSYDDYNKNISSCNFNTINTVKCNDFDEMFFPVSEQKQFAEKYGRWGKHAIYIKDTALISFNYRGGFASPFFTTRGSLAYDGDMMYRLPYEPNISSLPIGSATIMYLFKREEIEVSPSRENVEKTPVFEQLLNNKIKKIHEVLNDNEVFLTDLISAINADPASMRRLVTNIFEFDDVSRLRLYTKPAFKFLTDRPSFPNCHEIEYGQSVSKPFNSYKIDKPSGWCRHICDFYRYQNIVIINDCNKPISREKAVEYWFEYAKANKIIDSYPADKTFFILQKCLKTDIYTDYSSYPTRVYKLADYLTLYENEINTVNNKASAKGFNFDIIKAGINYVKLSDILKFKPKYTRPVLDEKRDATATDELVLKNVCAYSADIKIKDIPQCSPVRVIYLKDYRDIVKETVGYSVFSLSYLNDISSGEATMLGINNVYIASTKAAFAAALKKGAVSFTFYDMFDAVAKLVRELRLRNFPDSWDNFAKLVKLSHTDINLYKFSAVSDRLYSLAKAKPEMTNLPVFNWNHVRSLISSFRDICTAIATKPTSYEFRNKDKFNITKPELTYWTKKSFDAEEKYEDEFLNSLSLLAVGNLDLALILIYMTHECYLDSASKQIFTTVGESLKKYKESIIDKHKDTIIKILKDIVEV